MPEEDAAVIQADAAEHRLRRRVAELRELVEDERLEPVADLQGAQLCSARLRSDADDDMRETHRF